MLHDQFAFKQNTFFIGGCNSENAIGPVGGCEAKGTVMLSGVEAFLVNHSTHGIYYHYIIGACIG